MRKKATKPSTPRSNPYRASLVAASTEGVVLSRWPTAPHLTPQSAASHAPRSPANYKKSSACHAEFLKRKNHSTAKAQKKTTLSDPMARNVAIRKSARS